MQPRRWAEGKEEAEAQVPVAVNNVVAAVTVEEAAAVVTATWWCR